jgi:hypothetical protein
MAPFWVFHALWAWLKDNNEYEATKENSKLGGVALVKRRLREVINSGREATEGGPP